MSIVAPAVIGRPRASLTVKKSCESTSGTRPPASGIAETSQRVRESVLLRTLGATKAQVNRIMFAEYLALGSLGAAVGAVLAIGANWALAYFVFEVKWVMPSGAVLLGGWAVVSALTVTTGWLSNRGICDHPPLAVLREET